MVGALARRGISIRGAASLEVRGRSSGELRRVTVNPLDLEGATYLVAPRGTTQWVRNLRAAGGGTLRVGRRRRPFRVAAELDDAQKLPVLRAYLERWEPETKSQFETGADAPEERLREIAPIHPVFRLRVED